jgi:hypothetical protein
LKRAASSALLVGLAVGAAIGACGRAPPGVPSWQRAHDRRNEITALWTQIRAWRVEAGMQVEPDGKAILRSENQPMSTVRALCPDAPPPAACSEICDLADAICDNAESICGIAAELPGDDWASKKCDSGKASCREAKERCCGCGQAR